MNRIGDKGDLITCRVGNVDCEDFIYGMEGKIWRGLDGGAVEA